jgi:hypothetical protein
MAEDQQTGGEPCEDCARISGWGVIAAVAFAAFAAYVAADFATGGRMTALILALLPGHGTEATGER